MKSFGLYGFGWLSSKAELFDADKRNSLVVVSGNGDVLWAFGGVLEVACPIDIARFPFDRQKGQLQFTSWAYASSQVSCLLDLAQCKL